MITTQNRSNIPDSGRSCFGERWGAIWFYIVITALFLIRVWLSSSLFLSAHTEAMHDEGLFIKEAISISSGKWLGEYDHLTLIKGPFFSLFVSFSFLLGIRSMLLQQLLYCLSCLVAMVAVKPLIRSRIAQAVMLAFLLFNPSSLASDGFSRLLRDGVYSSLTLLLVAACIGLLLRSRQSARIQTIWAGQAGFYYFLTYVTREERVWFTPLLLLVVYFYVWTALADHHKPKQILQVIAFPIIIAVLGITALKMVNYSHYRAFVITEFDDRSFTGAYGSLLRVTPEKWQPLIPVARETREKIYAASSAFNELSDYFEGSGGWGWGYLGEWYTHQTDEIGGGWFMWALRDAVASRGYYSDYSSAHEFYERLGTEVNAACDTGLLQCGPKHTNTNPVWNSGYIKPIAGNFLRAIKRTVTFAELAVNDSGCSGNADQVIAFDSISRDTCAPPYDNTSVNAPGSGTLPHQYRIWWFKKQLIDALSRTYSMAFPWLGGVTIILSIGWLYASIRTKTVNVFLMIDALLLTTLATRWALLAYIHSSSFGALNEVYLSPLSAILILFIMLNIIYFIENGMKVTQEQGKTKL